MFDSATRTAGDLAGVFELEGEVGYFYLYETVGPEGRKVVASIRVTSAAPDFAESDVSIRWDPTEQLVALFLRGQPWAVFDAATREAHGGSYRRDHEAALPPNVRAAFLDA